MRRPLPPLRPKRAACGVAGLRSGSGQRQAQHALMAITGEKPGRKLFHLTYIYILYKVVCAPGVRPGNAPRGWILGPGAWRWDTSLFKNTSSSERVDVQFRVEATNVLNHTNFDQIGTFFLDPIHFGQVMSARDARIIQLGLKVVF